VTDRAHRTPFDYAVQSGDLPAAKWLVEKAAYIDSDDRRLKNNETPLYIAASKGHFELVKLLVEEKEVDVNDLGATAKNEALYGAVEYGDVEMVKWLVKKKADVNAKSTIVDLPLLLWAVRRKDKLLGHIEVVQWLLKETTVGVNVTWTSVGWTALHLVTSFGDVELVKLLVERKADVNAKTFVLSDWENSGWTPLHVAAKCGQFAIVMFLVEVGAAVDIRDDGGRNAMDVAETAEIAQYLASRMPPAPQN
jgi:ankyrin repeat protein